VSWPGPGSVVPGAGSAGRYRGRSGRFGWARAPSSFLVCRATASLSCFSRWVAESPPRFSVFSRSGHKRGSCQLSQFQTRLCEVFFLDNPDRGLFVPVHNLRFYF